MLFCGHVFNILSSVYFIISFLFPLVHFFDVDPFTYYIKRGESKSINDIQHDVKLAVDEFVKWQHSKIGRDINPSELDWRLKDTGIKRAVITAPSFIPLRSGEDHLTPQYARLRSVDIVNGGFENE